jgi:hypothetical protein
MSRIAMLGVAALLFTFEAAAQTFKQQQAWCDGSNPDLAIDGCTVVIQSGRLTQDAFVLPRSSYLVMPQARSATGEAAALGRAHFETQKATARRDNFLLKEK